MGRGREDGSLLLSEQTTDPFEQLDQLKALLELSADANLGITQYPLMMS